MANDEFFGDRRKAKEDEVLLPAGAGAHGKAPAAQPGGGGPPAPGRTLGRGGRRVLRDLQELGYTAETVQLLHLVPLIQMAWAEGSVSDRERALIVEAARSRGVEQDSAADRQLAVWLESRPSEELFEKTLRAVAALLQAQSTGTGRDDLAAQLAAIASASAGSSVSARSLRRSRKSCRVSPGKWSALAGNRRRRELFHQEIDDPFERIEAERRGHRRAQVRVRVDVVEHPAAVLGFEVFDAPDVERAPRARCAWPSARRPPARRERAGTRPGARARRLARRRTRPSPSSGLQTGDGHRLNRPCVLTRIA